MKAWMHKPFVLVAAACLLLLTGYQLAFKKTLAAWQLHAGLARQLAASANVSRQPGYLYRKDRNLDRLLSRFRLDSATFRANVVNTVARLAEQQRVRLVAVPLDDPFYHTVHFITQKVVLEGDYFALLQLLEQLEKTAGIGYIRSLNWEKEKIQDNPARSAAPQKLELYLVMVR